MIIRKISTWHKIIAEKKDNNYYVVVDCIKSIFGGGYDKTILKEGLSLAQVKQLKTLCKGMD